MLDFTKKDMLEIEVKVSENETLMLGFEKTMKFELAMTQTTKEIQLYMLKELKGNKDLSILAKAKGKSEEEIFDVLGNFDLDFLEFMDKQNENTEKQLEVVRDAYRLVDAKAQWPDISQSQYEIVTEKLLELYNEKK